MNVKLIDLLVQELPKRGGWPDGVAAMAQDANGAVQNYIGTDDIRIDSQNAFGTSRICGSYSIAGGEVSAATDRLTAIITRNQYEAALAASKPEWDGEGLPPVGAEVQCICNQFPSDGQEKLLGHILYSGEYTILKTYKTNGQHHVPVESVVQTKHWDITPIRSEADRKRDEAAKGLIEYLDKETDIDNVFSIKDVIGFYDTIAAGKIPHIRID